MLNCNSDHLVWTTEIVRGLFVHMISGEKSLSTRMHLVPKIISTQGVKAKGSNWLGRE